MPTVVLDGGSSLLKRHLPPRVGLSRLFLLDDLSLPEAMNSFVAGCPAVAKQTAYKRVTLRLNMDYPLHREAWEIISQIPSGHRVDAICQAVISANREEAQLLAIQQAIKEVMLAQQDSITNMEESEDSAVLAFLSALQEGDDT